MAVNVKMGVDIGSFTSGIREGQQILKGLNAEMKASEAEFKATGNSEQKLSSQTKTLNSQLQVQKGIADKARQALQAMKTAGVDPADTAYQKMYVTLMNAEAGANEAQAALNNLGKGAAEAAGGAQQLTNGLNGISKKISLEQVISGIDKITGGLENAAKKAVDLGQKLWDTIMDSARRADDTATLADMYGIPLERFMQMQRLLGVGVETTADNMLGAWDKLKKGIGSDSGSVNEILKSLHVTMTELQDTGDGILEFVPKDTFTLFWEAGQAIKNLGNEAEQEAKATKLFGKSWRELLSLFENYETVEDFNKAVSEQTVNSEEQIRDLAALNDAVTDLENSWTTLKDEMLGAIAPALKDGATAISGLLDKLTEYLKTDKGQEMLKSLGDSVSTLFEDLGKIDPETVVENFTNVFNSLVNGLQWIVDNKDTLVAALAAVVTGWGALKIGGGLLNIIKLIDGLRDMGILGGGGGTGGLGGTGTGTGGGGGWATGVSNWLTGKMPAVASFMSANGAPVMDWLTHESPFADMLNGKETLPEFGDRVVKEVEKNASTFVDDWAGVFSNVGSLIASLLPGSGPASQEWIDFDEELRNRITEDMNREPFDFQAAPKVEEGAAEDIASQVGPVDLPVNLRPTNPYSLLLWDMLPKGHANGLSYVPYDNYLALLHKGERVMTARENRNYTYNSHNYFGNVNLNNGQDIDALCNSIDRHNRRAQSGFGS